MTLHSAAVNRFAEYIPFPKFINEKVKETRGQESKCCRVKGWILDSSRDAKWDVESITDPKWIMRRLRVKDENGNYLYGGLIVVDVDNVVWAENVAKKLMKEGYKCQIRMSQNGGHFIFRFDPNPYNPVTSDYLLALYHDYPVETSHEKTAFVTDNVVDYKFTEIVQCILDSYGRYRASFENSKSDKVVMREITYDEKYSLEEQLIMNRRGHLPDWYPPYDEIPDWLMPIQRKHGRIPEGNMFSDEMEQMVNNAKFYINTEQSRLNAPAFIRCMNDIFKYRVVENSEKNRSIYLYNTQLGYYQKMSDYEFERIIKKILINQKFAENKEIYGLSHQLFDLFIDNVNDIDVCQDSDFDSDEDIVNFKNGILDLTTGKLKVHSHRYLSSIQIPCNWIEDDEREPKIFMDYLRQITAGLPDQDEIISMILQYCGCCLSNSPVYKTKGALIFQGVSDAGKSQIFNMMFDLLGKKNAITSTLSRLTSNRFSTSNIYGKRLTGCADLPHSVPIADSGTFKSLVAGDLIDGERKFCGQFSFRYKGGLIYCCNEIPQFGDSDKAVYNRLYVVQCNNAVPEDKQDPHLCDKFRREYPQIVRLMLHEYLVLKKHNWKLYRNGSVDSARTNYENQADNVKDFVDKAVSDGLPGSGLRGYQGLQFWYDSYVQFCKDYQVRNRMTKSKFGTRFEEVTGVKRTRTADNHRIFKLTPGEYAVTLYQRLNTPF